jgi:hypothetical protein
MRLYDPYQQQYRQLCSPAKTFAVIADQTIFNQINGYTTQQQFQAALHNLKALCERMEAQLNVFHYGQAYGMPHTCLRDIYTDAEFRLINLSTMHQTLHPQAPKPQVITSEGVVIDLEDKVQTNREETNLGTDDSTPDKGDTG